MEKKIQKMCSNCMNYVCCKGHYYCVYGSFYYDHEPLDNEIGYETRGLAEMCERFNSVDKGDDNEENPDLDAENRYDNEHLRLTQPED